MVIPKGVAILLLGCCLPISGYTAARMRRKEKDPRLGSQARNDVKDLRGCSVAIFSSMIVYAFYLRKSVRICTIGMLYRCFRWK